MGNAVANAELDSIADLLARLGDISPRRVRLHPAPGTATVADVVRTRAKTRRICELVDGTLVEKIMGLPESTVALRLSKYLHRWNDDNGEFGFLAGTDGTVELEEGQVRAPDLAFTYLDRLPGRKVPVEAVPNLAPDLAVEVLSEGNTKGEMERKLDDYFTAGVKLVWYIDPRARTVRVFTSPDDVTDLTEGDTLDGGAVLPGFAVAVARLFDQLAPPPAPAKPPKATGGAKKPKKRK